MSGRTRFPFTATQWQELEHQALIYKYMVSGIPIPPHLLFSIKTSSFFPPHIGWSCFQVGQDKKIDPEPGRCRRTDGKKWRCSKEAYPDSKYCERHMHRGKNRSRKPVEVSASPTQTIHSPSNLSSSSLTTTTTTKILPINKTSSYNSPSLLSSETYHHHQSYPHYPDYHALGHPQFLASHTSSSRPPGNIGISSEDKNSTQFLFDSAGSCSSLTNVDYRNREVYGMKEVVGEHAFFSETSGSVRGLSGTSLDDAWQLTPLTMSCSTAKQQRLFQHGYLLGNDDMKCLNPIKFEKEEEPQKTVHRFFDECPPKNNNKKDSWLDLDDKSSNTAFSTTSLSISIPSSSYDFPIFNSRAHNDG